MNPKLTDQALADLPLQAGRAELLEEIMSSEAPERSTPRIEPGRSRKGWLLPAAAAALVAAVAVASFVYADGTGAGGDPSGVADSPTVAAPSEKGARLLLDAPGWRMDSPGSDGDVYRKGKAFLEVTRYPARSYADYVTDREHITDPPAPGIPIVVLGHAAQMWAYSADDHAAIREVVDGTWMEFRGQGLSEAAYLDLLGSLRTVSREEFEAALPPRFVTGSERSGAIEEILQGIEAAAGPARSAFPMGQTPTLQSAEEDPYQLGAYVAGQVACAWLDQYAAARASGDQAAADDAAQFLATSHDWPVLLDMDAEGDYSEVVWDFADEVAAGQVPDWYDAGLGCR